MLLERRAGRPEEAIEHLVGMQAQEAQAPYLGLWARLQDFAPDELSELIANRKAVRGGLMRSTIHLVTARDYTRLWPLMSAVLASNFRGSPFSKALPGVDRDDLLAFGQELLARQPCTRAELSSQLAEHWPGVDPDSLANAVSFLTPIVQVPPRGLWRQGGQARWTTAESWLELELPEHSSTEELIQRYLAAFGPATVRDIQAWCGLTRLRAVVERLPGLRIFRDEQGKELVDVPDAPLPHPNTSAPTRFLPPFDNAILSHADRSRIIAPEHRSTIYRDRQMRAFLIDGFVAGTWRIETRRLHVEPINSLHKQDRDALVTEAEKLFTFLRPDDASPEIVIH
jgi:hypothetical protein